MTRPIPIALLLSLVPGLAIAGGMHAGATVPRPPVAEVAPPIHPPGARHAFVHPAPLPVFFNPPVYLNPPAPGFVTFAPTVVIVAPAPMPVHQPVVVAAPPIAGIPVAPPLPPSDLFFAPPVRVVAPPSAGGQVLIIRRHTH